MSDVMRDAYCVLRIACCVIQNTKHEIRFISQNIHPVFVLPVQACLPQAGTADRRDFQLES